MIDPTNDGHEEIRISIDEAEEVIKLKDDINKLTSMPLFIEVVGEKYFKEESVRLVSLMGEDNVTAENKIEFNKMMYGIAYFQRWLRHCVLEGMEMEQYVENATEELNRVEVD